MTRPSIVRADTIDLQDHDAPSAKSHRQHPHAGAHQAETLREVAHEAAEAQARSPRLSWNEGAGSPDEQQSQEDLASGVSARMADATTAKSDVEDGKGPDAAATHGEMADSSDEGDELDDDDIMDRMSSSPSIEDEDIDFEFVYALHTFVATVEGQANATKGDTMVLLDDSNSYWWLVRVVKDSSIGYLPAEHIETPTERLARLNKHRNVDLSAAMLGDNAAKQKSSFKGIRKRWKSVTFAEPTYVDYTNDFDNSTDEEDIEELFGPDAAKQDASQSQTSPDAEDEATVQESARVEPLKTRKDQGTNKEEATVEDDEAPRASEEILDGRAEPRRTQNGTVRDSFFKDDSVETKKISLTPNLLRDDNAPRPSTDSAASKDLKTRGSLDKLEKELVADKDRKKTKDKKPSAIRSFFSRKDKKRTSEDDDGESFGKRSMDIIETRESEDPVGDEEQPPDKTLSRSPSKLQKQQPRIEPSPAQRNSHAASKKPPQTDISQHFTETRTNDVSNVPPASMRIVDPETQETMEVPSNQQRFSDREEGSNLAKSLLPRGGGVSSMDTKPQQASEAKARMELDDSDSSDEERTRAPETSDKQEERQLRPQLPGAFPDSFQTTSTAMSDQTIVPSQEQDRTRLSESPVEVSLPSAGQPPELTADSPSPGGSTSTEPGPMESTAHDATGAPFPQQQWDDEKLRAFFDEGDHVRDLLAVVYDTSGVEPAGDHPIVTFHGPSTSKSEIPVVMV
ncbi:Tip elongation aberrant protein-like protein [Emericellopsis cladophorae]|uniref:Tip elongation aberrant protein-like protein n=1 Tax=Emericellopsis cladophorae TaxID=2686198 RepID=A0A9Q0BHS9_9HYPO|nr:Tip elongation aberrant protein-like protein [Emericellopsis cladophorae]KAI6784759.1 Tip elongation aberrant protein-like protein [Emericellopsis cladophorae]